jgi:hypothetical protein
MKRVCAWCNKDMGSVERGARPDTGTSHGICAGCLDNFEFQQGVPLQRYVDSIPLPVLVVDRHVVVKTVNRKACEALCKEPPEMVQHLAGNVFECAYARLPGGCGGTVHCSGCAIRRSITRTYETGEPQTRVPAVLHRRGKKGHAPDIALTITTVRSGDMVVLRVDAVEDTPAPAIL